MTDARDKAIEAAQDKACDFIDANGFEIDETRAPIDSLVRDVIEAYEAALWQKLDEKKPAEGVTVWGWAEGYAFPVAMQLQWEASPDDDGQVWFLWHVDVNGDICDEPMCPSLGYVRPTHWSPIRMPLPAPPASEAVE